MSSMALLKDIMYVLVSSLISCSIFVPCLIKMLSLLRGFEMLRAVHLEPIPFDIDRDLITPTFKLKRPQLLKYYKASKMIGYSLYSPHCITLSEGLATIDRQRYVRYTKLDATVIYNLPRF